MVHSVSRPIEAAPPGPRVCPRFLPSTSRAPRSLLFHTDFTKLTVTIKSVPTTSTCSRGELWYTMGTRPPSPDAPRQLSPTGGDRWRLIGLLKSEELTPSSCGCAVSKRSPLKGKPPPLPPRWCQTVSAAGSKLPLQTSVRAAAAHFSPPPAYIHRSSASLTSSTTHPTGAAFRARRR